MEKSSEGFKRKLSAILSADVVGYNRLMQALDLPTMSNGQDYGARIPNHWKKPTIGRKSL